MSGQTSNPRSAADWFLTVHATEDPSPQTLQEWLDWLEASPQNRRAFEQVAQIWHNTPSAMSARRGARAGDEDYDGLVPVAEWRARQDARGRRRARKFLPAWAAAAGLGAVALLAYWQLAPGPVSSGEFATRTSEHRELKLEDGSTVTLGAHSRLAVNFTAGGRELRLQAGEAFFSVAKDAARPFTVVAREGAITALGTAFNVRTAEERVTVTVMEGSVKVAADPTRPTAQSGSVLRVEHGQQLTYRSSGDGLAADGGIRQVDAREASRWREGWLVYRDESLRSVIADVSRYTQLRIAVSDEAAGYQFSGAVSRDRIAEWIAALPEVAAVSVEASGGQFSISARPRD